MAEARSPAATVDTIDEAAVSKSVLPNSRLFVMSVLGGMFIAVGALLAIVVAGGSTELVANNPGLARLVMGVVFPVGFIAVMLTGAGLFTSDCPTQAVPWYRRRVSGSAMLRLLIVAYLANVVGAGADSSVSSTGSTIGASSSVVADSSVSSTGSTIGASSASAGVDSVGSPGVGCATSSAGASAVAAGAAVSVASASAASVGGASVSEAVTSGVGSAGWEELGSGTVDSTAEAPVASGPLMISAAATTATSSWKRV